MDLERIRILVQMATANHCEIHCEGIIVRPLSAAPAPTADAPKPKPPVSNEPFANPFDFATGSKS